MTSFVLCTRNIDTETGKFGSAFGGVSYLSVSEGSAEPLAADKQGLKTWLDAVMKIANPIPGDATANLNIVFFVHGYNTDPCEALKRQRLVEKELSARSFRCVVIGFDWPTEGDTAAYLYDRSQAQIAAVQLVKGGIIPFAKYTVKNCTVNVHVMAHSMGGFVVREAFRNTDKTRNADFPNDWRIGQMVFFAADVSSESFAVDHPDMVPVFSHCGRLTNYFSGYDEALGVSSVKNLDISSRVGRVGMPKKTPAPDKAVDVDCGPLYASIPNRSLTVIRGMVSHSWYLEDPVWYNDLAFTLSGAIDRNSIPNRTPVVGEAGGTHFVLNPSPILTG